MKNPVASIKTLVLLSTIAFAGHVLAAPTDWFNVTAVGNDLVLSSGVTTNGITEGVEVADSVLSIDLPASEVFQITPEGDKPAGATEGKTYIDVDGAVFTPTYTNDIDNTVLDGAQTALTVAYDDAPATNYYAYIGGEWIKLAGAEPSGGAVDVRVELDYSNSDVTNVSFWVGSDQLYDFTDNTKVRFPISGEQRALGHVELAGYGKIHSVTTTVEAVANVTVTPGTITYGADFTNVTITAKLSGTGYDSAEYSLTWNGASVDAVASVSGDTLTIIAPINPPAAGRAPVTYAINVNGAAGETQNTVVADTRAWVTENAGNYEATGTWSNDFEYVETVATIADNTYTANSCTTGDLVTITFENLVYTEFSDLTVETPDGTQGAFALAEDNGVTSFYILAKPGEDYVWTRAAWAGGTPSTNVAYTVEMAFNYTNNTYSVKVSDESNSGSLSVNSATEFNICKESTKVTGFVFKGSGTMTGIQGVDSIGYMAKDNAGHWYATIDDAAGSGGREFIVLRPTGPAPSGWKFVTVDGVKKLIKNVAKGMFFMAY